MKTSKVAFSIVMAMALLPASCVAESNDPAGSGATSSGAQPTNHAGMASSSAGALSQAGMPGSFGGAGGASVGGAPSNGGMSSNAGASVAGMTASAGMLPGGGSSSGGSAGAASAGAPPTAGAASGGVSGNAGAPGGGMTSSAGSASVAGTAGSAGSAPSDPDPTCATGILKNGACCAASCGACGGAMCGDRPGGSKACCTTPILDSGVSCDTAGPPCIVSGGGSGGSSSGGSSSGGSSSGGGGSSSGGASGGGSGPSDNPCDAAGLVWKRGAKTNFESYPDPGSEECIKYNGCMWAGQFAFCDGTKSEEWVSEHNLVAVFPADGLAGHDLCLKKGTKTIVVTVVDTCGDDDCDGCCTENRGDADALVDLEKYTNQRWGVSDGEIQFADLGANPNACE